MGTRHLICVVTDGEFKVAQYGQWDGYLDGHGIQIAKFIKKTDMEEFKRRVEQIQLLDGSDIEKIYTKDYLNDDPVFSRNTGSRILTQIMNRPIQYLVNNLDFANDSLFCEWCYIIDLDEKLLEIYEGFNKEPLCDDARFYCETPNKSGYYPVKLYRSLAFDGIVTEMEKLIEEYNNELENGE